MQTLTCFMCKHLARKDCPRLGVKGQSTGIRSMRRAGDSYYTPVIGTGRGVDHSCVVWGRGDGDRPAEGLQENWDGVGGASSSATLISHVDGGVKGEDAGLPAGTVAFRNSAGEPLSIIWLSLGGV